MRIVSVTVGLVAVTALAIFGFLYWQGTRTPATDGEYVALGSSFAAGIGLGPRAADSPIHCFRTTAGYPAHVAKRTGLRLVDMTCSGSTSAHILDGGQLMLGPQLAAVGPEARLVTITTGGNDVGYIGDLMTASGSMGVLMSWINGPIRPAADRPYDRVTANLKQIVRQVRIKAPDARIMLVSYPAVLADQGNCAATGVSDAQARISRDVAARLAAATRIAAEEEGALLIDMAALSKGHDVCSDSPWVYGAVADTGTAFHPNAAGSAAIASSVIRALAR
jgi:lysophospholipase L1-like esterase